MKKLRALLFAVCVLACAGLASAYAAQKTSLHSAQDTSSGDAPSKPVSSKPALDQPSFKKMMESGWPSATKNAVLARLGGEWHYKMAFWAKPGAEPKWTTGTIKSDMTLDDRFLSSTFVGELEVGGNAAMIKGQGLIGYDNAKKSFTSVWVDTLSTGMMVGVGKYDPKTNAIVETGSFTNPVTGTEGRFRSELKFTDPDDYKRTIFAADGSGRETRLMEFDYSRKPL